MIKYVNVSNVEFYHRLPVGHLWLQGAFVDCGIFLNRDYNAAVNIGRRCADAIFHESKPQDSFPSWADVSTRDVDAYLDALETKLRDRA